MRILIAGDLVPTESNYHLFKNGSLEELLGQALLDLWMGADIRLFNLETPLTDIETPLQKNGPNLRADKKTIKGISQLQPTVIALSNNHILDQGVEGLKTTTDLLEDYDLNYVGVGHNLEAASDSYTIQIGDKRIGVYACCDYEFSVATPNEAGANPFNPLESLKHISELKNQVDYVIVLYHGGTEEYRYPTPNEQKICRKMVVSGADIVVAQHSHCIGAHESYKTSEIVYGQGNFIFDMSESPYWATSILIEVILEEKVEINYHPIVKKKHVIRLAQIDQKLKILKQFDSRSKDILIPGVIDEKYNAYSDRCIDEYLRSLAGFGKWFSRIDRHLFSGKLIEKHYKKKYLMIQNYLECDAHRELLIKGLKRKSHHEI